MQWKVNNNQTICDLKDNELQICIHKILHLTNWYLNCKKLNIIDYDLKTTDFTEAVKKSQVLIMEQVTEIYELASLYKQENCNHNEFTKY